jgi:hypothetical protein
MFLGSRARPVCKADNLIAIYEATIWTMWNISRPPRPLKEIVLLFLLYMFIPKQHLSHVCVDFTESIETDNIAAVCNSLPKTAKILDV